MKSRLDSVLDVLYFMFNEGYAAHEGGELIRQDLCLEALRLARLVASSSIAEPRADALVALMALQAARQPARVDHAGDLIVLEDQDRSRWDRQLIGLGFAAFRPVDVRRRGVRVSRTGGHRGDACARGGRPGSRLALDPAPLRPTNDTEPSPVVALNRAVAVAKVHGAATALEAIEPLGNEPHLRDYYLLLAVRGHLLLELGRGAEAAACFHAALERPCSEPERRFLKRKLKVASEESSG